MNRISFSDLKKKYNDYIKYKESTFILPYGNNLTILYTGCNGDDCLKLEGGHEGDVVEINGEHFEFRYFTWVNEKDQPADPSEVITNENFNKYNRPIFNNGWSKDQLLAYFRVNILPKLQLNMNINHPKYKSCITKISKKDLIELILSNIYNPDILFNISSLIILLNIKNCLLNKQEQVQESITNKIRNITNKKKDPSYKRFKWENLCSVLDKINIHDLYELAAIERIPYYSSMSRREVCAELSKLAAERMIRKGKIEHKCLNKDSISGDSIKDIPAEFFVSFYDNNKLFCEDIRSLYKIVNETRYPKNPWNGVPFSKEVINLINDEYNILERTVNTFKDLNTKEEPISITSLLTQKVAKLLGLLNYPNNGQFFIDASNRKIQRFINKLKDNNILDSRDSRILLGESSKTKKMTLVNILINKIEGDRNQVQTQHGVISNLIFDISEIYNSIFNENSD